MVPFAQRALYEKNILDIDLRYNTLPELLSSDYTLVDGDIVRVFSVGNLRENQVEIYGNVKKPGAFELKPGMRVGDLIMDADSLEEEALDRGVLFRMLPNRRREALRFDPIRALAGDENHNLLLRNEDSLIVYRQSDYLPENRVAITGAIKNPNFYVRARGMTLNDLVLIAGGLTEDAELSGWEVSRLDTTEVGVYTRVIRIEAPFQYWGNQHTKEFLLQDNDYVFVPFNPRFQVQKFVDVQGYVMFPGPYPIRFAGERLVDIIRRAGGLRPSAYLQGSVLVRRGGIGERIATGPVDIDFQTAFDDPTSRDNITLHDRDSIYVAQLEDVVRVFGEVHAPSAVLYVKGAGVTYYLQQAGGVTDNGEESKVVVALPGGKKWEPGWWFLPSPDILPGSRIYVPRKVEKEDKTLPVIRDLATILASLAAITVALVQVTK